MGESPTLPGVYLLNCQVCIMHFPLLSFYFILFILLSIDGCMGVELDLWGTVNMGVTRVIMSSCLEEDSILW